MTTLPEHDPAFWADYITEIAALDGSLNESETRIAAETIAHYRNKEN